MSAFTKTTMLSSFLTAYPGKALWTLFALSVNAIRLPLWMIYYIPTFTRPHARWSWKQAVRVRVVRAFLHHASTVEMKTPLSLEPGKEGDRFVVLPPSSSSTYVGPLSKDPNVQPARIGATWYPSTPSPIDLLALKSSGKYIVLHLHGGAYAIGDGRTEDAGFAAATFLRETSAAFVLAPQYRLTSNPGCAFPAQLQDAVTAYAYLLAQGVPAERIVLSGDSAGANLALALVRYITVLGQESGLKGTPAGAWLWSCWVNPSVSVKLGVGAMDDVPNKYRDYVGGGFGLWGAKNMIPSPTSGLDMESEYISFGGKAFKTEIPLYISTGECEVLYQDDTQLYQEFSGIGGNKVGFQIEEDCVHDVILTGKLIGFEAEAARAAKRAGQWLQTVMPAKASL